MKKFALSVVLFVLMIWAAFVTVESLKNSDETWQVVNVSDDDGIISEFRGNMTVTVDNKGYTLKSQENSVFISGNYYVTVDDTKTPNTLEDSYIKAYHNDNYFYDLENLKESEY